VDCSWKNGGKLTRQQIRDFAAGGFGGVELISLELSKYDFNSDEWNEVMLWIFDEADKCNIKVVCYFRRSMAYIPQIMISIEDRYDDLDQSKLFMFGQGTS
jgi:hypothetical protein